MFGRLENRREPDLAGIGAVQCKQVDGSQNGQEGPGQQKWRRRPNGDFQRFAWPAFTPAHQHDKQDAEAEYAPGYCDLAWD